MGCDIHMYVEYQVTYAYGSKNWSNFGGRFNPGRNYSMFGILAGVRDYEAPVPFPTRGLPKDDLGWVTEHDNTLYVSDDGEPSGEGFCSKERAEGWVAQKLSEWANDQHTRVTHPDWHSHSWLTTGELEAAYGKYKEYIAKAYPNEKIDIGPEYKAILNVMKTFETEYGYPCRVVFWFDN